MKKSLSLLTATSMVAAFMPLAFAESSMSSSSASSDASSVSSSSSSSSSSVSSVAASSSTGPCFDKTGSERIVCMNDLIRMKKREMFTSRDTRNTKKAEIVDACGDKKGVAKAVCVRRTGKAMMKTAVRKIGKIRGQVVEQEKAMESCTGLRGTRLALCFRNLKVRNTPTMGASSSSAASSVSSAN